MARELENSSGLAHMLFIQGFMFDTLAHSTAESGIRKSKKASPAASAVFMFAIPAAVEATNGVSAQLHEQAARVRASIHSSSMHSANSCSPPDKTHPCTLLLSPMPMLSVDRPHVAGVTKGCGRKFSKVRLFVVKTQRVWPNGEW
jgi:hypothetical protein